MDRAVDGKIKIPGSSPTREIFFSVFFFSSSAFAEGGAFFCQKKLRIFSKMYYINCRYDRRFTEDLRPPLVWQMNSNYGSLGEQRLSAAQPLLAVMTKTVAISVCLSQFPSSFFCCMQRL